MELFNILGWIIIIIVCFICAPCMTIGVILINANDLGFLGDVLGTIFLILGIIHMFVKIDKSH